MAGEHSLIQQIDAQLDNFVAGWSIYSTILTVVLGVYLVYPLFTSTDPDIHPYLLARQAVPAPIRQPGESAVYRSSEAPHHYPLRSGLNIKDPGASKWTSGRDGDLRDIWREAVSNEGAGTVASVKGRDQPVTQKLAELTKDVNAIGESVRRAGSRRVAIYLPNSVEFLVAFFGAAFYGFVPILIPQSLPPAALEQILRDTKADALIAQAGTVSFQGLTKSLPSLKQFIRVVEHASRQMDWSEGTEDVSATEWHEIVKTGASDIPTSAEWFQPPNVIAIWQGKHPDDYEFVEYCQASIIAAVAAQLSVLPRLHHLEAADSVVPLDSLALLYPLTILLAVLYSKGSIILTSAAGPTADFDLGFQNVSPSIVIASTDTLSRLHVRKMASVNGVWSKYMHTTEGSRLAAGSMRKANTLRNLRRPRLIYTYERIGAESTPLSPVELSDLRITTGARLIYALTAATVAGAVAQTSMLDYRTSGGARSHFGPPLSCVEIMLVDTSTTKISDDENPIGEIVVTGPAAALGKAKLGVLGTFGDDYTLSLV